MTPDDLAARVERRLVDVPAGALEVFIGGPKVSGTATVCTAHPAGVFGEGAVDLLHAMAGMRVVAVNPRGIGQSSAAPGGYGLDAMVDDLDAIRSHLGIERWTFWGMSGGGWLGLAYAYRHPGAIARLIVESVCPCFRERLADSACVLSPFHPSWRPALERLGLIEPDSHLVVGNPEATEWVDVEDVGSVFRRRHGPALLVSPMAVSPEMRAAMPLLWTVDFRDVLPMIRVPTLVIGGSADPIVPLSHVRAVHAAIAGSGVLAVEGAGHVPTTERRPEIAGTVRSFLRGGAQAR